MAKLPVYLSYKELSYNAVRVNVEYMVKVQCKYLCICCTKIHCNLYFSCYMQLLLLLHMHLFYRKVFLRESKLGIVVLTLLLIHSRDQLFKLTVIFYFHNMFSAVVTGTYRFQGVPFFTAKVFLGRITIICSYLHVSHISLLHHVSM